MTATRTPPLGRRVGAGGEAEVYTVADRPDLVYKRYRRPRQGRAEKLEVMLRHPPPEAKASGPVAIAWPRQLVLDADGAVDGFLMTRVDLASSVPLFQVYNPQSRRAVAGGFTWRYLVRTARNVAAIVDALHRAGYVIGDLNESNLLVSHQALVTLVDCDSLQVRDPASGEVHRCWVGKPEFTAPEFHGADLATTDRTDASDDFALAVLIFLSLMEGTHPFAGVWSGRGDPPDVATRMRRGAFAYRRVGLRRGGLRPPPFAMPLRDLPPPVRRLARRAFTTGTRHPNARPSAADWVAALDAAERTLRPCRRSPHHVIAGRGRRCPWCARVDRGMPDPFPGPGDGGGVAPRRRRVRRLRLALPARLRITAEVPAAVTLGAASAAVPWAALAVVPLVALTMAVVGAPTVWSGLKRAPRDFWESGRESLSTAGVAAAVGVVAGWRVWVAAAVFAAGHLVVGTRRVERWRETRTRLWATMTAPDILAASWLGAAVALAAAAAVHLR